MRVCEVPGLESLDPLSALADVPALQASCHFYLGETTPEIEFSTASAWGVTYEMRKLAAAHDVAIIDTPPKADSDLKPALRASALVLIPVATSHLDLWAVDVVLYLANRESKPAMMVMTRARPGTRLAQEVTEKAAELNAALAETAIANRVVYAETLGQGRAAVEAPKGPAHREVQALIQEIETTLGDCPEFCALALRRRHWKRSSNIMARWLFTACHCRMARAHSRKVAVCAR